MRTPHPSGNDSLRFRASRPEASSPTNQAQGGARTGPYGAVVMQTEGSGRHRTMDELVMAPG